MVAVIFHALGQGANSMLSWACIRTTTSWPVVLRSRAPASTTSTRSPATGGSMARIRV
jgi:hypothetical protein